MRDEKREMRGKARELRDFSDLRERSDNNDQSELREAPTFHRPPAG